MNLEKYKINKLSQIRYREVKTIHFLTVRLLTEKNVLIKSATMQDRFNFLLQQTDIFKHFMEPNGDSTKTKG